MSYRGKVKNGTIVLLDAPPLPEDTEVEVIPLPQQEVVPPPIGSIYDLPRLAVDTGIPDLARNLDHYLYGHPKEEGTS